MHFGMYLIQYVKEMERPLRFVTKTFMGLKDLNNQQIVEAFYPVSYRILRGGLCLVYRAIKGSSSPRTPILPTSQAVQLTPGPEI